MSWTWLTKTGRPCLLCQMKRNGRSTAARRRWVGPHLYISFDLWLAFCWLAAWTHSLKRNCQQWMLLKASLLAFWISSTTQSVLFPASHFCIDVNVCTYYASYILCSFFFAGSGTCSFVHKCTSNASISQISLPMLEQVISSSCLTIVIIPCEH